LACDDGDLFRIFEESTGDGVTLSLRDARPRLCGPAELRMRMLARRVVARELHELLRAAEESLRSSGYSA
jgi:hypothetical protein